MGQPLIMSFCPEAAGGSGRRGERWEDHPMVFVLEFEPWSRS